jgi:hypothetical protein
MGDILRMGAPDSPKEKARKVAMATRLQVDRCPIQECDGRLTVQSAKRDDASLKEGHTKDESVARFSVGCTGTPMHVFRKEDLFFLRDVQPEVLS